jgi:hypothetical protein
VVTGIYYARKSPWYQLRAASQFTVSMSIVYPAPRAACYVPYYGVEGMNYTRVMDWVEEATDKTACFAAVNGSREGQ